MSLNWSFQSDSDIRTFQYVIVVSLKQIVRILLIPMQTYCQISNRKTWSILLNLQPVPYIIYNVYNSICIYIRIPGTQAER